MCVRVCKWAEGGELIKLDVSRTQPAGNKNTRTPQNPPTHPTIFWITLHTHAYTVQMHTARGPTPLTKLTIHNSGKLFPSREMITNTHIQVHPLPPPDWAAPRGKQPHWPASLALTTNTLLALMMLSLLIHRQVSYGRASTRIYQNDEVRLRLGKGRKCYLTFSHQCR